MRAILLGLAFGLAATAAAAQDAPPPGCRWQGFQGEQILACKDGRGHWRRSGDDMIVGTYPMAKPKPKPVAAAPKAATAPVATGVAASTTATGAPVVAELAPPAPPPPPDEAAIAAADAADAAAAEASTANASAAAEPAKPAPAAKTPWWKGFLDGIWQGILGFLKLIGLVH